MVMESKKKLVVALCALLVSSSPAFAAVPEIVGDKLLDGLISTMIYSAIGIVMAALSFKIIDAITPGDLSKQLTEEKNVALGVMVGLQAVGISIIIAAAIAG